MQKSALTGLEWLLLFVGLVSPRSLIDNDVSIGEDVITEKYNDKMVSTIVQ